MALFDLHSHFSFKPANSRNFGSGAMPDPDHWRERIRRRDEYVGLIPKIEGTVIKTSQAHVDSAVAGGFRTLCNVLYPLEQGFVGGMILKPTAMLCGFSKETLTDIRTGRASYFQHLEREYLNLVQNQSRRQYTNTGNSYRVVDSYAELERTLNADNKTLCLVNTIEGAHAFADNLYDKRGIAVDIHRAERSFVQRVGRRAGTSDFELYIESMVANIDKVTSNWSHTPFFVTFAHHYYNHLCGHSPSLDKIVGFLLPQHGSVLDHDGVSNVKFYNLGIRPWGKKILAHLLRRRNQVGTPVRRVLIDTKHMSPQARIDYMDIVNGLRANDHIPVIVSHTAVSGRKDLRATAANDGFPLLPGEKESTKYFYDGVINLFDDEIAHVVGTDGIIGLMIDERRIMGVHLPPEAGITMKQFEALVKVNKTALREWYEKKHKHAWGEMGDVEFEQERTKHVADMAARTPVLKPCYLSVLFRQMFHILDLVGKAGWDHIALGTDYDGLINPVDLYTQASDMSTLKSDLVDHWKAMCSHIDPAIKELYDRHLHGKSQAYWMEKVLNGNGMEFLRKYYHDDYLLNGKVTA